MASEHYSFSAARERAADAPYTFYVPSTEEVAAVQAGDLVKLVFEYLHNAEEFQAERMWVKVTGADGEALQGTLDNQPYEKNARLSQGDLVSFRREHIIDIIWGSPGDKPPKPQRREYWDRCLVDACVLDGTQPVEYLYREEGDLWREGDKDPDSGWRIRGRDDPDSNSDRDERPQYVALGIVLNRDDSWLHLIDAPVGSAYLRDFNDDSYKLCE